MKDAFFAVLGNGMLTLAAISLIFTIIGIVWMCIEREELPWQVFGKSSK